MTSSYNVAQESCLVGWNHPRIICSKAHRNVNFNVRGNLLSVIMSFKREKLVPWDTVKNTVCRIIVRWISLSYHTRDMWKKIHCSMENDVVMSY